MQATLFLETQLPLILCILSFGGLLLALFFFGRRTRQAAFLTTPAFDLSRRGLPEVLTFLCLLMVAINVVVLFRNLRAQNNSTPPASNAPVLVEPAGLRGLRSMPGSIPPSRLSDPSWIQAKMPRQTSAPDFTLPDLRTGKAVNFAQERGSRPAVLVFGSAGARRFCDSAPALRGLHRMFEGQAAFVFVHVTTGFEPLPPPVIHASLRIEQERKAPLSREDLAACAAGFCQFPFPCLLDTEDGKVEALYDAYPQRLVVVDAEGRIVRDFGRGLTEDWSVQDLHNCLTDLIKKAPPRTP